MKARTTGALLLALLLSLSACGAPQGKSAAAGLSFTDSRGNAVDVQSADRVVCLYASYAQAWLSAGGSLLGVTQDAVEERGLAVGAAEIVGTVKAPNLEKITALQPDFVLLTADISGQLALDESLTALGIAHSYFTADRFEEYVGMMEIFLRLTGKTELREELIEQPEAQIASARAKAQGKAAPTALLMRASSAGVSVRAGDTVAGAILRDLGVKNIAEKYPSLLRELSFETILQEDPDFIFVTTMGTTEKAARANLQTLITKNAAWGSLSAVRENHYFILQKELYHYKPNEQWGVAYAKLAEILYGE